MKINSKAISFFYFGILTLFSCDEPNTSANNFEGRSEIDTIIEGKKKYIIPFENGKKDGQVRIYDEKDNLVGTQHWEKDTLKIIETIAYFGNGRIKEKDYSEGIIRIEDVYDSINGQISERYKYLKINGELHLNQQVYFKNGKIDTLRSDCYEYVALKDTIKLGEKYTATIKLVNPMHAKLRLLLVKEIPADLYNFDQYNPDTIQSINGIVTIQIKAIKKGRNDVYGIIDDYDNKKGVDYTGRSHFTFLVESFYVK